MHSCHHFCPMKYNVVSSTGYMSVAIDTCKHHMYHLTHMMSKLFVSKKIIQQFDNNSITISLIKHFQYFSLVSIGLSILCENIIMKLWRGRRGEIPIFTNNLQVHVFVFGNEFINSWNILWMFLWVCDIENLYLVTSISHLYKDFFFIKLVPLLPALIYRKGCDHPKVL